MFAVAPKRWPAPANCICCNTFGLTTRCFALQYTVCIPLGIVVFGPVVYGCGVNHTHTEGLMQNLDLIRRHFPKHANLIIKLLLIAICAGLVIGGALLLG